MHSIDAGIALLLALCMVQVSIIFLNVVVQDTVQSFEYAQKQKHLLACADSLINNPALLAKYDRVQSRTIPHTIVNRTVDIQCNYSIVPLNVRSDRTGLVVRRLVFVEQRDEMHEAILEVW